MDLFSEAHLTVRGSFPESSPHFLGLTGTSYDFSCKRFDVVARCQARFKSTLHHHIRKPRSDPKQSLENMTKNVDKQFYDRADAVISIANEQAASADQGHVSASLMYATARYNSYVSACKAASSGDLASGKEEILEYFVEQYPMMLAENLDDQIANYDKYNSRSD